MCCILHLSNDILDKLLNKLIQPILGTNAMITIDTLILKFSLTAYKLVIPIKSVPPKLLLTFLLSFSFVSDLIALDVVTVNVGESSDDQRIHFKNELVKRALEITSEQFGPYKIVENTNRMNITRAFSELEKGENLSLTFAHTREEFEQMALPVRVPIRQGIGSYRLLLVRAVDEARFDDVSTLSELKEFKVGLSPGWSTYSIMKENGFEIVNASDYKSMFRMLQNSRYDFLPRALNEVYGELERNKTSQSTRLAVLPNIALYIPSASYMFVSKKQPRIYERMNTALHAMSINGDLARLTDKYYKEFINKAELHKRKIITVHHSNLPIFLPHQPIANNCLPNQ